MPFTVVTIFRHRLLSPTLIGFLVFLLLFLVGCAGSGEGISSSTDAHSQQALDREETSDKSDIGKTSPSVGAEDLGDENQEAQVLDEQIDQNDEVTTEVRGDYDTALEWLSFTNDIDSFLEIGEDPRIASAQDFLPIENTNFLPIENTNGIPLSDDDDEILAPPADFDGTDMEKLGSYWFLNPARSCLMTTLFDRRLRPLAGEAEENFIRQDILTRCNDEWSGRQLDGKIVSFIVKKPPIITITTIGKKLKINNIEAIFRLVRNHGRNERISDFAFILKGSNLVKSNKILIAIDMADLRLKVRRRLLRVNSGHLIIDRNGHRIEATFNDLVFILDRTSCRYPVHGTILAVGPKGQRWSMRFSNIDRTGELKKCTVRGLLSRLKRIDR